MADSDGLGDDLIDMFIHPVKNKGEWKAAGGCLLVLLFIIGSIVGGIWILDGFK